MLCYITINSYFQLILQSQFFQEKRSDTLKYFCFVPMSREGGKRKKGGVEMVVS